MAVYDLSGSGVQLLSPSITRLFVEVLLFPVGYSIGRATPTNYFDVGLLRVGVSDAYERVIPIDADHMFIDLPAGATSLGFSCFDSTVIRVSESFPVPPPGAGETFLPSSYVPDSTFLDTTDTSLNGAFFVFDDGYLLTALRYWRPPADTGDAALEVSLYNWTDDVEPYHETVTLSGFGWNEWAITPIALPYATEWRLGYLSFAGRLRANPDGAWSDLYVGSCHTVGQFWVDGSTLVHDGSGTTVYAGMDCRIALP